VELAKRLGCATTDLQVRVVDCPPEKMGPVIGKNGTTIKQLEDRTGVQVDVDKVGCKIHLQGSETALRAAVEELESITLAVEELVDLKQEVLSYLFANVSLLFLFDRMKEALVCPNV
jgi:polyribonucleotide nucleotidyltransferase